MKLPSDLSFKDFMAQLRDAYSFIPAVNTIINDTGMTAFKVLISAMMSSRTKDEVTVEAAKRLFKKADTAEKMLDIKIKEIEQTIYPVGFYKTKAKNINRICKMLIDDFSSIVPDTVESLTRLPGVGIKTAALVLIEAFGKPEICVDTHVHRIPNRMGIIKTKTPEETRTALKKLFPQEYWMELNRLMVSYGRTVCKPLGPKCPVCIFFKYCNYARQV